MYWFDEVEDGHCRHFSYFEFKRMAVIAAVMSNYWNKWNALLLM